MSKRIDRRNVTYGLRGGVIDMSDDCQLLGVTKNRNELMGQRNGYERCVNVVREKLLAMQIVWVENLLSKVYLGPMSVLWLLEGR